MSVKKRYLGDGVYADFQRGMVILTTENGAEVTNTVCLESEVGNALVEYMKEVWGRANAD